MLFRLSSYFKRNVVAFLALFVALGGTGAYAANTIRSTDIVDGQVNSADVKDQSLTTFDVSTFIGADIVDGSLTAQDVSENEFNNLSIFVGVVNAQSCKYVVITVTTAENDHMVLTPNEIDTSSFLTYGIEYDPSSNNAFLKVCNPTNGNIDDVSTHFNLLVFQH